MVHKKGEVNADMKTKGRTKKKKRGKKKKEQVTKVLPLFYHLHTLDHQEESINTKKSYIKSLKEITCPA